MANPVWPATVRLPKLGSWQETMQDNTRRFKPAVGPDITGPRATSAGSDVSAAFELPLDQWATLKGFWRDTLKYGSLAFDMTHPLEGGTSSFKFAAPPQYVDMAPTHVLVTVQLQRLP